MNFDEVQIATTCREMPIASARSEVKPAPWAARPAGHSTRPPQDIVGKAVLLREDLDGFRRQSGTEFVGENSVAVQA